MLPTPELFISYAQENKSEIVDPLVGAFEKAGIKFWRDENQIGWGQSLVDSINQGLTTARRVIAVISEDYLRKSWTMEELDAIRSLEVTRGFPRLLVLLADEKLRETFTKKFPLYSSKRFLVWKGDPERVVDAYQNAFKTRDGSLGPTRICMISSEYPPHVLGGLGVHVTQLTEQLGNHMDVDLVLPTPPGRKDYDTPPTGISTHPMGRVEASYDDVLSWVRFAHHVADNVQKLSSKPAVIHCHDWVTVLGGLKCRASLKIPLVFHVHLPNRTPFCSSVENLGILCADLVTVNSKAMREQLRDRFPDKRIEVVPNGVDTRVFRPADPSNDPEKYIFFAGRLVEQKGVDTLLRAFVHITARFPQFELWIAGTGPCKDAYERMANCLELGKRVQFLDWKSAAELNQLYREASVAVVPSIYEPFGMTALEAMACSRAVVASKTGGLSELIKHGKTGFLTDPGDHLDLAQWIMHLLAHKDFRHELGRNAGEMVHRASSPYQWSAIASQYAGFYDELSRKFPAAEIPGEAIHYKYQIRNLAHQLDPFIDSICRGLLDWVPG